MKNPTRLCCILLLLLSAVTGARAQGDLLVTPRRVVFEGARKMQELNLANTGQDTNTYLLSLIEIRMNEDGSFDKTTEPDSGQRFASPYLRLFPRRVTLAPKEAQVVKVQLAKTDQLQPGEYRSHLYVRAAPEESPRATRSGDSAGISVSLTPVFGMTIPLIIRVGEQDAQVQLTDLSLSQQTGAPRLKLAFRRQGSMSVYGDLKVEHLAADGRAKQVGAVKGIAVYSPNALRWFQLELAAGGDYRTGKLRVSYEQQKGARTETLAEAVLPLQ